MHQVATELLDSLTASSLNCSSVYGEKYGLGEPCQRKYTIPGHPPGCSRPPARGGSAATRATRFSVRIFVAAADVHEACLGSQTTSPSNRPPSRARNRPTR